MVTKLEERLAGRVAVVTGAGNGIGQACALSLAAHGASVVVNDLGTDEFATGRSSKAANDTVQQILDAGGKAVANYDSVAESAGCENLVAQGVEAFGKVDIVVGCAGAIIDGSLNATDEHYQRFMDLFLGQKFWLARAALPGMLERGWGRFVTTTSHGATGMVGKPVFAAAMSGVIGLTKAIAHEHRDQGVTANCLAPAGATRLHATTRARFESLHDRGLVSDEVWENYDAMPPPAYVAPIVTWLCTDQASGVSGEVFHAKGNLIGRWTHYREERVIKGHDHTTAEPWSLHDLDDLVGPYLL